MIDDKANSPVAQVFAKLLVKHLHAAQEEQEERRLKLKELIDMYEVEFPEECRAYRRMYGDDTE